MRVIEALQSPYLLGDGACGTALAARGYTHFPCDFANLEAPDLVLGVHREYLDAGSQVIETNTFSANPFRFMGQSVDFREVNLAGARIARQAAGQENLVLGAVGPAGKPIEPIGGIQRSEFYEAIKVQAEALAEGGVDGFLLETFLDIEELKLAFAAVRAICDLPILVSKAYIEDGEALSAGLPTRCAEDLAKLGPVAIGANCIVGPQRMLDLVRMIADGSELPVIAYPTPGMPQLIRGKVAYDASPEYFAKASVRLIEEGAKLVGGCCGTTPDHIAELGRQLGRASFKVKARRPGQIKSEDRAPVPTTERTPLYQKLRANQFVTTVEMDVPRGLNYDKFLANIRAAKEIGVDLINISDGARARLRMNPMAVCHRIQNEVGMEAVMHFACRDRNLLAIQADLLGCHALGVRNILCVTGDPANIGDYPSATSVFDVDSIGLVRILSRLNEGLDLAGYTVGLKTGFTIAVAYNPVSLEPELETDRLKGKADAGAELIYTQPIFDLEHAEIAVEAGRRHGLPVFLGVMPLRSSKHAEFMHNEVPGVEVPDWLRQKLADAQDEHSALETGIAEAQKLASFASKHAAGLYVMPPANNMEAVRRLMEALG